jgi:hypothetical protein
VEECAKEPGSSYQQASANHQPLCERLRGALRRMWIVRTELQAWNGVSGRLSFFWPRRWPDPHYALPAGLGEEQWGASELRASTVPPRSAMSGGRTGTRSARAKPCSDCASSCPIFREQAIEPIAGTDERSATKVFRAGLSTAHAGFISLNAPYDEGLTFTPLPGNMVEASGNWERHYCRLPVRVWHMLST